MGDEAPTIFEWGGGRAAFERWLNTFYDLVEGDELLAPVFGGKVTEEHRRHVTAWWCEVMGGPAAYTEEHGGYRRMLARHRGLAITAEQRLRFVTLLSHAADRRTCRPTPSSAPRSSATPSGAAGSPCTTPSPARRSCRGAGAALGLGRRATIRAMTVPHHTSLWPRLADLPLVVEGYELEGLTAELADGMIRTTIQIRLQERPRGPRRGRLPVPG